jgi:uncharacterized YigZ family protein
MAERLRYPVPAETTRVTDEVKNSRFITTASHCETVVEAEAFVASIKREYPDANHNCWAYVVGPPGSLSSTGASDDGEPGGTAGRPMLNVLLNTDIGDVAVVVTRYFGGVKLGRGGLIRAYSGGVVHVLREMLLSTRIAWTTVIVSGMHDLPHLIHRLLDQFDATIASEKYGDGVALTIRLPEDQVDGFQSTVVEMSNGTATLSRDGT